MKKDLKHPINMFISDMGKQILQKQIHFKSDYPAVTLSIAKKKGADAMKFPNR